MKKFFLLLVLILLITALTPLMMGDKGYVLVSIGQTTLESTVVTAIFLLTLIILFIWITIRLLRYGVTFSFSGWHKLVFFRRRKALKNFQRGIAAYVLSDYQQAENLLAKCAETSGLGHIAYLVAADAAQKQSLNANVKHYLAMLDSHVNTMKYSGLEAIVIKIKLLIEQKQYRQARNLLDDYHKHIGHDHRLLALEIDLSLLEKRFDNAIKQLALTNKNKNLTLATIEAWQKKAFYGIFSQQINDKSAKALTDYWHKLASKVKKQPMIVLAYCQVLAEHSINQPLAKILLPVIKKGRNIELLKAIRTLPITQSEHLIAAVQKHLHHDQHDPFWLSLVAHLAANDSQWGLAEKAFYSLVNLTGEKYDKIDLLAFATVLEKQQKLVEANQVLRKIHLS